MLKKIKQKLYNLLRWSEKWTKTDMVYLAHGGFWLTSGKAVNIIAAFALAIAYANFLPKEAYATYKYILSIAGLLGIFTLQGINTALVRSVALGYEGSIRQAIKTKMAWGMLGALAGIIISAYYLYQDNYTLGLGFLIASLFVPLIDSLIFGPYLQGKKLFKTSAIYQTIRQVIIAAVLISALFAFRSNILVYIFIYYLANFALQLILFIFTFKKHKLNKKIDPETIPFGKHLSFMGVLGMIAENIDKIIMWHFFGPIQLAIYAFAVLPVEQLRASLKSVSSMSLPKLAMQDKNILKKTLPKKIIKFTLILSILVILYALFIPYVYKIFFPEYIESIKYSQFYAIALLFFPFRLFGTSLTAHVKKKYLYIVNIFPAVIKIFLLAALIPLYGIWGGILALVFSSFANSFTAYFLFKKM